MDMLVYIIVALVALYILFRFARLAKVERQPPDAETREKDAAPPAPDDQPAPKSDSDRVSE
jgi:hypothetical protein